MESEHELSSFTNNTWNVCLMLRNAQTNAMSQCAQNFVDGFFGCISILKTKLLCQAIQKLWLK